MKEAQIRDGLHVFGQSPDGSLERDLVRALVRLPRSNGEGANASLHRAIAEDFELGFDPLDCDMASPWQGERPAALAEVSQDRWRTAGDTVERVEEICSRLLDGETAPPGPRSAAVLGAALDRIRPLVQASGPEEARGILTALDGKFVPPGPSGAPTTGRPDVLPTGRNFYSVDTRSVPTPTAWDAWVEIGVPLDRAPHAGSRRLAESLAADGLGDSQHAHRGCGHCPGVGLEWVFSRHGAREVAG